MSTRTKPKRGKLVEDQFSPALDQIETELAALKYNMYGKPPFKDCETYQTLKSLPADEKIKMLVSVVRRGNYYEWPEEHDGSGVTNSYHCYSGLLDAVLRTKLDFKQAYKFSSLFSELYDSTRFSDTGFGLSRRPLGLFVSQIEKHIKQYGIYDELRNEINIILDHPLVKPQLEVISETSGWEAAVQKSVQKLKVLVFDEGEDSLPPYEFGSYMVASIIKTDLDKIKDKNKWHALFHHLATASGSKPSNKFIEQTPPLIDDIGTKKYKAKVNQWLGEIANLPITEIEHTSVTTGFTHTTTMYIEDSVFSLLKGMCWSLSRFHDQETLKNLATITEKCFQKIPGKGPAAAAVGNAAIYTLAQSKGLDGISHLSRLKLRIRQNNTQKIIQKYIDEQAEKLGISSVQVEELAAPDFELQDGMREEQFDDYTLRLLQTDIGQTEIQWFKPDGNSQKTVPAFVKANAKHSDNLKKIRDLAKQIKQASTAQRDRIDRLYVENLSWDLDTFNQYYLQHGLVGHIGKKLIWCLDKTPGIFHEEVWQDVSGKSINTKKIAKIELWHPINSKPNVALQWRDRLEKLKIKQPFKQAHREIYLLTDAEIKTRVYSNRMAAHFLKQHQFNSLAALRGWKYSLLGAYDDGRDGEIASKPIKAYQLNAQYLINEVSDDTQSFNEAGIWNYVATDQVRFRTEADEPVALTDVPPIILSEVMRDADLFVGVASVGNDPTWEDGGPTRRQVYRRYWQGYSFGELTEVAKTRKTVLEKLLPKLKIRDVASIDGKYLVVVGKNHSYKIHIGSTNILISPNDIYLCIVPGGGKDKNLNRLFLPFEGDAALSVLLSKAFLLADDDKITDPAIANQIALKTS